MVFENLDKNMEIFHFCTGETNKLMTVCIEKGRQPSSQYLQCLHIKCTIVNTNSSFYSFVGTLFRLF